MEIPEKRSQQFWKVRKKFQTHTTHTKPTNSYVENLCVPLPTMVTLEMASGPLQPPWARLSLCEPEESCQPPSSLFMAFPTSQCILGVPNGLNTYTYAQCYGTNGNPLVLAVVTLSTTELYSHHST